MSSLMTLIMPALAALLLSVCVLGWCHMRTGHLKAAREWHSGFAKNAKALIKAPGTPDMVISFATYLAENAGAPRLSRTVFRAMLLGGAATKKANAGRMKLDADLAKLSDEQKQQFANMVALSLLSSAASDPCFAYIGMIFAALLVTKSGSAGSPASLERAETVASHLAMRDHAIPTAA